MSKWRKVPPHIDVEDLPDVFYCRHMQPYDPKHARCDIPEESTSSGEKTTSYSYEVGGINLDTLKVGDWLDAVTMRGSWMEVQVTNILEPGEIQHGEVDPTPTNLPKRKRLESGKLSPKIDVTPLRRIKIHYYGLDSKHDCYICSASPNIYQYLAPHFTYTKVPSDWELRVANGATEPDRTWDDLVLADITRIVDTMVVRVENMLKEETQENAKKKAKRNTHAKKSKKRKREESGDDFNGGVFENLKPEPPSAVELFVDANWDDFESSNAEMTTKAINKSLKLKYSKLSSADKQPWLIEELHQLKTWGNLYLLFIERRIYKLRRSMPKGGKPRKFICNAYTGFDHFYAKQRSLMAIGGYKLPRKEARIIWDKSLPKDMRKSFEDKAKHEKNRLTTAWHEWELRMERQNKHIVVVKLWLNDIIRLVVNEKKNKNGSWQGVL